MISPRGSKPIVVFVTEAPETQHALRRLLGNEPFELRTTSSADEARSWIESCGVEILLAEQYLADGSGIVLLEEARRRSPRTVRVLLTDRPDLSVIFRRVDERVQRLVTKPWSGEELRRLIRNTLETRCARENVPSEVEP